MTRILERTQDAGNSSYEKSFRSPCVSRRIGDVTIIRTTFQKGADADIEAVFTDDQKKILPDFKKDWQVFQQVGLPVGLTADLNLTDDQKKQMVSQAQQNRLTIRQKMMNARFAGTQMTSTDHAAMMKESRNKILAEIVC